MSKPHKRAIIYPLNLTRGTSKAFDYVVVEADWNIIELLSQTFSVHRRPFRAKDVDYVGSGCGVGYGLPDISFQVRKTKLKKFLKFLEREYGIKKVEQGKEE